MTATGETRASRDHRWLTPSHFEVRDDSWRHDDPSDKRQARPQWWREKRRLAWDKAWGAFMRVLFPAWRLPYS